MFFFIILTFEPGKSGAVSSLRIFVEKELTFQKIKKKKKHNLKINCLRN